MHIISTVTTLALLSVAIGIIANMLVTYRHMILDALKAEPVFGRAVQPVGYSVSLQATETNSGRVAAVGTIRSKRPELMALAA